MPINRANGEYRRAQQQIAWMAFCAAKHHFVAAFLKETGQYVTNDATREAAIANAIAADRARQGEPIATLHDDGYFTFKPGKEPHQSRCAGWRMDVYAAPLQAQDAEDAEAWTDSDRLNWLDKTNRRLQMGWKVGKAPAGNVSVTSVVMGKQSIREAIDAAAAADIKDCIEETIADTMARIDAARKSSGSES